MITVYYSGPRLAAMFDPRVAEHTAGQIADAGGDELHDLIVRNTPIHTGKLRESWYRDPTVKEGDRHVSRVKTDVEYAPYVNYGTGLWGPSHAKYPILPHPPKQFLHWIDPASGRDVFARKVMHPGSPPQYMIESGAAKLEATIGLIAQKELEKFKVEIEALAQKAQEHL